MGMILRIEWLNSYTNGAGKKGSVQGTFQCGLKYVRAEMKWFGLNIDELVKPEDQAKTYEPVARNVWFTEPAVMCKPPSQAYTGEYDKRLTIFNNQTGEVFYKAEMLRENYKPGSSEPFELCREILFNIEKYKTLIPVEENL